MKPLFQTLRFVLLTLFSSFALNTVVATEAQPRVRPLDEGLWPTRQRGSPNDVAVENDYAYLALGRGGLAVLDVKDRSKPVWIGQCALADDIRCVHVSGTSAYVADSGSGLQVIDVSNPGNPIRAGGCRVGGDAHGVDVVLPYAYVASTQGLTIVDVSNPTNCVCVGSTVVGDRARDVKVEGGYAYVAAHTAGLRVIDVTNPAAPRLVGGYDSSGLACAVQIVGKYAYLADESSVFAPSVAGEGLVVLDVSDPANPVRKGAYGHLAAAAEAVHVVGNYAYLPVTENLFSTSFQGLLVVDVSDPSEPVQAGAFSCPWAAQNVYVAGEFAYVTGTACEGCYPVHDTAGLQVIDVSKPAEPVLVGTLDTYGSATSLKVSGTSAYVVDNGVGLQVIDVTDPEKPVRVARYDDQGRLRGARSVHVAGHYAYLSGDMIPSLRIIDVSDATHPLSVGEYRTGGEGSGGEARAVSVVERYAYVATGHGLQVVDVSNAAKPVRVGGFGQIGGGYSGVDVVGGFAYLAGPLAGLHVIYLPGPTNCVWSGGCAIRGDANCVQVVDGYAYVTAESTGDEQSEGLEIIDVRNPERPVRVGAYQTGGFGSGLQVVGQYAFVADWRGGLHVLHVGDPANPKRVAGYHPPHGPAMTRDVFVSQSRIYVAFGTGGLLVLSSLPNFQFAIRVEALAGVPLTLETTPSLAHPIEWTTLVTTNSPTGPFDVVDFDMQTVRKFYRAHQP